MSKQISVIIVNYNGVSYLENCFNSIHLNLKGLNYEIIIWDNASIDDSCKLIQEKFKDVKLFCSSENFGFGKGNNEAVNYAVGKYILLLNNDTILLEPINELIDYFENNKNIGLLGIKMLNGNNEYVPSVGRFPKLNNLLKLSRIADKRKDFVTGNFKENVYEVEWLSGSFLMSSKENFDAVKGFDTDFFMYVEDVDLSKKYTEIGLKNVFYSKLSYIHFVGFNKKKNHLLIEGYKMYINKHFKGVYRMLALIILNINKTIKKIKGNYN